MAKPAEVVGTEPGFGSALTVLLAMGVLYLIVSGTWNRLGAAWRTLYYGGGGLLPPIKPTASPGGPPPWSSWLPHQVNA